MESHYVELAKALKAIGYDQSKCIMQMDIRSYVGLLN
jgi:hypothetical protein